MKYALIGCGRIATNHVKAVVNNHLEFVAACDIAPENIETLLAKHDLQNDTSIQRYTNYKKMIAENDLELISIATESGIHAEIALYCIDHGINVIIEKPMAMSMRDANEIIRRSEEKHVKVAACHQTVLILPFRRCVRLWKQAVSENSPMVLSMYAGTEMKGIIPRRPGGENGRPMVEP